jgi:phosphoribosylanthranilate isomerase
LRVPRGTSIHQTAFMTWVKICGTTNLEDALVAVNAGADALGFVFYDQSPRKVDVETARDIVAELPERVDKVGVFVDQSAEQIREIVRRVRLRTVQLHGETAIWAVLSSPGTTKEVIAAEKIIVVLPGDKLAGEGLFLSDEAKKKTYAILLESGSGGVPGGTGKTFDWKRTRGMVQGMTFLLPVIIAGGLNPSNVGEAMKLFQPFGVDVASGVEARPGKKDPEKVRAFVQAVRRAEKSA